MTNPRIEPLPPPLLTPNTIANDQAVTNIPRELPSRENTDRFEKLMERPKAREREQSDSRTVDPAQSRRRDELRSPLNLKIEEPRDQRHQEGTDSGEMGSTPDGQAGLADSGSQTFSGSMGDGSSLTFAELIKQSAQLAQPTVSSVELQSAGRLPADRTIQSLVNEVADRITIASTKGLEQEVRIQVRESLLAATEIRILQQHGQLQVQLITGHVDSFDLLSANQSELVNQLNQRLSKPVEVQLSFGGQFMNRQHQTEGEPESRRQDDRSSSELDAEEN